MAKFADNHGLLIFKILLMVLAVALAHRVPEKQATLDRAHFKTIGEKSLDFELVYYIPSGEHKIYMDIQQRINFSLLREFRNEGISFAFSAGIVRPPPQS